MIGSRNDEYSVNGALGKQSEPFGNKTGQGVVTKGRKTCGYLSSVGGLCTANLMIPNGYVGHALKANKK